MSDEVRTVKLWAVLLGVLVVSAALMISVMVFTSSLNLQERYRSCTGWASDKTEIVACLHAGQLTRPEKGLMLRELLDGE